MNSFFPHRLSAFRGVLIALMLLAQGVTSAHALTHSAAETEICASCTLGGSLEAPPAATRQLPEVACHGHQGVLQDPVCISTGPQRRTQARAPPSFS